MLQGRAQRHQKHRLGQRLGQSRQAQDHVVVLGQIAGLATAPQDKPDQIQIAVDHRWRWQVRVQTIGGNVLGAAEEPPINLLQRFRAVKIHLDPVAMCALGLHPWRRLSGQPCPQVRRQHKRHVGIGQRPERPGGMDFAHQDRRARARQAGHIDMPPAPRRGRRFQVQGLFQIMRHLGDGGGAERHPVQQLVDGRIVSHVSTGPAAQCRRATRQKARSDQAPSSARQARRRSRPGRSARPRSPERPPGTRAQKTSRN